MSQNCRAYQRYWGAENTEFLPEERGPGLRLLPSWSKSLSGSKRHLTSVDELRAWGSVQATGVVSVSQKAAAGILRPQSSAGKDLGWRMEAGLAVNGEWINGWENKEQMNS